MLGPKHLLLEFFGGYSDGVRRKIHPSLLGATRNIYTYQDIEENKKIRHAYRIQAVGGVFKAVYTGCELMERRQW